MEQELILKNTTTKSKYLKAKKHQEVGKFYCYESILHVYGKYKCNNVSYRVDGGYHFREEVLSNENKTKQKHNFFSLPFFIFGRVG